MSLRELIPASTVISSQLDDSETTPDRAGFTSPAPVNDHVSAVIDLTHVDKVMQDLAPVTPSLGLSKTKAPSRQHPKLRFSGIIQDPIHWIKTADHPFIKPNIVYLPSSCSTRRAQGTLIYPENIPARCRN